MHHPFVPSSAFKSAKGGGDDYGEGDDDEDEGFLSQNFTQGDYSADGGKGGSELR